jgi:hypothetical protein
VYFHEIDRSIFYVIIKNMSKNSFVSAEFNVPRTPEVLERTQSFFREIGWRVRSHSTDANAVYVHPLERGVGPVIRYWHTANPEKTDRFVWHNEEDPSKFSRGLWHPVVQDLTELILIVPDAHILQEVYTRGGSLLESHTHMPIHEDNGAVEFRYTDPFNNALRIVANPGYEI